MTTTGYEILILGTLGPAAQQAFADLTIEVEMPLTVLSGELDQAALHLLLDRVRALGLELVEVRQTPRPPSGPPNHP